MVFLRPLGRGSHRLKGEDMEETLEAVPEGAVPAPVCLVVQEGDQIRISGQVPMVVLLFTEGGPVFIDNLADKSRIPGACYKVARDAERNL